MNENESNLLIESGKRLKEQAQKRGLSNQAMADLLHYKNEKSISAFYSGKKKLSDDRYQLLAREWQLNESFLRGISDFETDQDIEKYASIKDREAFEACRGYLKSLSFELKPFIKIICSIESIYKNIDILPEYVTPETMASLLEEFDFSLDFETFSKKYLPDLPEGIFPVSTDRVLFLKKPFEEMSISIESIGKNHTEIVSSRRIVDEKHRLYTDSLFTDSLFFPSVKITRTTLGDTYNYEVGFHAYFKNEYQGTVTIEELQRFMTQLDAFTRCAIDTLLIPGQRTDK